MNKKFTKLIAALALMAFMTPSMVGWGQTWEKITSLSDLTSGENYLLVYENSTTEAYIFNGNDEASDYVTSSIASGVISSLPDNAAPVTITSMSSGGYSIQIISTATNHPSMYIYGKDDTNSIQFGTSATELSIEANTNGSFTIKHNTNKATSFRFNKATGNYRFRFYKVSTTGNSYVNPCLYKYVNSDPTITIGDDITELAVPNYVVGTPANSISYETFTVNGSNLEGVVTLALNENSNFQMSTDLETWNDTLQLTPTDGSINEETVAVRLKSNLSVNDYSGSVTLSSTDAESVTISLSGSVVYAHVTYNGNGATSGSVPVDNNNYSYYGTVTVLGAGDLVNTGHAFDYWTTDAEGNVGPYEANDTYTITDNTTFYAQWSVNTHTVTMPEDDDFGIYMMTATNPVAYGTEVTLQYEPEDGYEDYVAAWSINGEPITGNTFTMPDENVTVTVTCSPAPGTATNPYTVAQARAAIDANTGITGVYATGIIYQVDSYNSNYNSITYWISDDGTSSNPLEVYSGISGIEGFTFSSKDDLRVGDVVVVKGNLKKFNNSVYEFDYNNQLVSLVREYRVTYDANGATSGTVPTDETVYNDENNTVTVLGNTGTLVKDCNNWGGWNTEEDGSGDTYQANQTFTITSNTTLYAIWTARTHSYTLNQSGATQYIEEVAIYVPDQGGWEEGGPIQCGQQVSVSVILDNENYYYTISVMAGSESVTVNNDMFTMPDSDVTITVTVSQRPQFNITCNPSIGNGNISVPATAFVEETVVVTVTPETGYTLNTLTATYVDGNGDTQSLDFFGNTFVMPAADVMVSAMFSKCVEDVLNLSFTGVSGTSYKDWTGKTGISGAVYTGNSAGGNSAIQLRSSSNSGIITTGSGGKAKKVVVSWNSSTADGRVLQIYGKNTAYSSTSDLYNNNNKGTLLGYISYNSSTDYTTELIIPGDYEYIGIRSSSGALYLDEIRISWVYSYTEEVTGHGDDNTTGWQFIASPILDNVTVSVPAGDDADLYYYDEQDHMWRNYKKSGNDGYFNFANGTGYLYANRADAQVTFAGASVVTGDTKSIELSYHENTSDNEPNSLAGWNLVGNPFDCNATLNMDCYTINGRVINTQANSANSYTVAPCTGVMVKATPEDQTVTFTKVTGSTPAPQPNQLQMTVAQQVLSRGTATSVVNDNAIVNFNEGSQLEKFIFNIDAAKLYIPQNDKEYAIVSAEAQGEMPLNFRANADGQYTLTVNPEGVEMNYLHLVDNMTGNDIDLLQTPSYSFNATTNDYESRFRLVFAAANNEDGASTGSASFAFMSDGNWIINNAGEATLQVIDINGRILSSERVNGSVSKTINATPGVYMLRLINGENVMVQKIVVR